MTEMCIILLSSVLEWLQRFLGLFSESISTARWDGSQPLGTGADTALFPGAWGKSECEVIQVGGKLFGEIAAEYRERRRCTQKASGKCQMT